MLAWLCGALHWRRPKLWFDACVLCCDSTTEHDELTAKEIFFFWGGGALKKCDHSPFLPNVAPFDFWLLTELKTVLSRPEIF